MKDVTVIDIVEAVDFITRAGGNAGVVRISKLAGITRGRGKRMLSQCMRIGLLIAYRDGYNGRIDRLCYGLSPMGTIVQEGIAKARAELLL